MPTVSAFTVAVLISEIITVTNLSGELLETWKCQVYSAKVREKSVKRPKVRER